jgi:hypothetical protein
MLGQVREKEVRMVSSPLRKAVVAVAALVSIVSVSSRQVAGQAPAKSPARAASAKAYVPPKTPWGDPDLQGNFTNKYEQGTPFERPAEFDGKRIEDVQGQELADLVKRRQELAIERAPFLSGDPTGKIAGPMEFRDIYEISKAGRPWFVVDPPDGKIPPTTAEGQRRIAARPRTGSSFSNGVYNSYEDLSLYDRCITRGYPSSMLPAIYGDSYQIVQGMGFVAIRIEMIHETRVIPLDNRPHVSQGIALDMGDPRGHWEGHTLVVETTNFRDRSIYRNGNPGKMRLIEKFTRVAPGTIEWAVTVDDPTTWARSWTFSMPLTMNDAEPVYEYACHEGNYAIRNILNGSRVVDQALDEKK